MKTILLKKKAGLTLIELLVSISIILMFFGVAYVGISGLQKRQTLLSTGQNLKNLIRDAQNRAYNHENFCEAQGGPCYCGFSDTNYIPVNEWRVDFINKSIYGICNSPDKMNNYPTIILPTKNFDLNDKILITPAITANPVSLPNTIIFSSDTTDVNNSGFICLNDPNLEGNNKYIIRINKSGLISDDGGLVATCP
jgi:prepilin-type N-terminal cleavage/methylation domain-containing protein